VKKRKGIEKGILTTAKTYEVSVDEVDCMGRIKPSAWLMYMQDIATEHAEMLGIGYHTLYRSKSFWIMTQVSVRVYGYVKAGSHITLRTYPLAPGLVECVRDTEARDEKGNLLMQASTRWCIIDENFRLCKARPFFARYKTEQFKPEMFVPDVMRKILLDGAEEKAYDDCVRYCDMDRNRHLNNVHYADMMLNAYGEELLAPHDVTGFDLAYRKQTFCGERYAVYRVEDGMSYGARGKKENGEITFEARFTVSDGERSEVL